MIRRTFGGGSRSGECASLDSVCSKFLNTSSLGWEKEKQTVSTRMAASPDFWASRPLSASQQRYAALDAAVLLPLHSRLLLEMELLTAPLPGAEGGEGGGTWRGELVEQVMEESRGYLDFASFNFAVADSEQLQMHMVRSCQPRPHPPSPPS